MGNYESYHWHDGSTEEIYTTGEPGLFWLEITDKHGCRFTDSIMIDDLAEPFFDLGPDTMICMGTGIMLSPGIDSAFHQFNWSDGSSNTFLMVSDSGEYFLQVTNPCGEMTDGIFVGTYNCDDVLIAPNAFTPTQTRKSKGTFLLIR